MDFQRLRRLKQSTVIQNLSQEDNNININKLICPLFLIDGQDSIQPINSMPDYYRYSVNKAIELIEEYIEYGLKTFILFPVIEQEYKTNIIDKTSYALSTKSFFVQAIAQIKNKFQDTICLISDIALDPYTIHGHDGIYCETSQTILNDQTIHILAQMSLLHAQAGIDMVAPSDMMDGRIQHIRAILDDNDYINTGIISYSAKFNSNFYGPFRDAVQSTQEAGIDKSTYQLDYSNTSQAIQKSLIDLEEGADMIIVKPALAYLDIITKLSNHVSVYKPVIAYQVSGEYTMAKLAAQYNYLDEYKIIHETLTSIIRAGANSIITYHAMAYAKYRNIQN